MEKEKKVERPVHIIESSYYMYILYSKKKLSNVERNQKKKNLRMIAVNNLMTL